MAANCRVGPVVTVMADEPANSNDVEAKASSKRVGATDIFVSYKSEDRPRVLPLVRALEAEGFSVWWDSHIGGGARWRKDIADHLQAARCVIVVWTNRSVGEKGEFVQDEATWAHKRGKYLPVRLDMVLPPLGFGEVQVLPLKGWKGDRADPVFRAVADAVRLQLDDDSSSPFDFDFGKVPASRRGLMIGGATAVVAAIGGWLLLRPAPANARRLAVLPFDDLSPARDQGYFAEGIAEELRAALSRIGLELIGSNSSEAVKKLDLEAAARKLDVAHIVTGSVRRSPSRIRIEAQLVSGSDGVQRWMQSYDRKPGDEIDIQTEIAASVAEELSITLGQAGRKALTLGGTSDAFARDRILLSRKLGRESSASDSLEKRVTLAEEAIARDPRYADAYVEKAIALFALAVNFPSSQSTAQLEDADSSARKAVSLAPKLGTAHFALGRASEGRLDFVGALRHTRHSLELTSEEPDVLARQARSIALLESPEKGLQLAERAIELDPLNSRSYRFKCEVLTLLRRYPQAIEAGLKSRNLAPTYENARIFLGEDYLLAGRPARAIAEYEGLSADTPFRLARLALAAAIGNNSASARQAMADLRQRWEGGVTYQCAEINAQLGDGDGAFAELSNAIQAKDSGLIYLKTDPFLDPIRNDPRFSSLLEQLKFP